EELGEGVNERTEGVGAEAMDVMSVLEERVEHGYPPKNGKSQGEHPNYAELCLRRAITVSGGCRRRTQPGGTDVSSSGGPHKFQIPRHQAGRAAIKGTTVAQRARGGLFSPDSFHHLSSGCLWRWRHGGPLVAREDHPLSVRQGPLLLTSFVSHLP